MIARVRSGPALFAVLILIVSTACLPQYPTPLPTPALPPSTQASVTGTAGTLSGTIVYQSGASPASMLYAVSVADPQLWFKADLPPANGPLAFSLEVTAGAYQLIARALNGDVIAALPSTGSDIGAVTVDAGQTVAGLALLQVFPQVPCQITRVPASPDGLFPAVEPAADCGAPAATPAASGDLGRISGYIGYGAFPSPASVLYAISTSDPQAYYTQELSTSSGLLSFSIQVPPGSYQLIARTQDGASAAALHSADSDIGVVSIEAGKTIVDLLLQSIAPEAPCQTVAVPASPDGRFPAIEPGGCVGGGDGGGGGGAAGPTSSSGIPNKPGSFFFNFVCEGDKVITSFSWVDMSDNEIGFRLYRDGGLLATLPADTTTYQDSVTGKAFLYTLTAYNNAGESDYRSASVSCP